MAAAQDGKTFKQDMVVSIRYRNDLPPPPFPPKLLNIDHEGIAQYLTPGFASGLARREEPNIDADAEGGMPIDMIGIPGYFLGDESAIMAPEVQPVLDLEDTALLMTPDMLKKEGAQNKGFSFLRKTQYMTGSNALANTNANVKNAQRPRKSFDAQKLAPAPRDDKENIKRNIQKGFDLAYPDSIPFNKGKGEPVTQAERHAWKNPVHPDNQNLKPVGFFPVLPDLDAGTDAEGKWNYLKFSKPPLPAHRDRRDERIDVSLLLSAPNPRLAPAWRSRKDAFDKDPKRYEDPGPAPDIWSLYVPKDPSNVAKLRSMLNNSDLEKDNPSYWRDLAEEDSTEQRVPFSRTRAYPAYTKDNIDPRRFMALSLYDPTKSSSTSRLQSRGAAAYYYPVQERLVLKTEKVGKGASQYNDLDDDDMTRDLIDDILLSHREPSALEVYGRTKFRKDYDYEFAEKAKTIEAEAIAEQTSMEAAIIEAEQGTLQGGEQDVSMAEIHAAGDTELAVDGPRDDRDDQGLRNGHATGDDDEDLMEDE